MNMQQLELGVEVVSRELTEATEGGEHTTNNKRLQALPGGGHGELGADAAVACSCHCEHEQGLASVTSP
jgi:hypothetical protein